MLDQLPQVSLPGLQGPHGKLHDAVVTLVLGQPGLPVHHLAHLHLDGGVEVGVVEVPDVVHHVHELVGVEGAGGGQGGEPELQVLPEEQVHVAVQQPVVEHQLARCFRLLQDVPFYFWGRDTVDLNFLSFSVECWNWIKRLWS